MVGKMPTTLARRSISAFSLSIALVLDEAPVVGREGHVGEDVSLGRLEQRDRTPFAGPRSMWVPRW